MLKTPGCGHKVVFTTGHLFWQDGMQTKMQKKTSVIIGLATAISPIPPVQRRADVEKRSQNFSKLIISLFWQIDQLVEFVLQHPRGRNEP